jgi:hypothetical protein
MDVRKQNVTYKGVTGGKLWGLGITEAPILLGGFKVKGSELAPKGFIGRRG